MSAQTMAEVWGPMIDAQRERVYQATWGHLAPKRNKRYKGAILFAHGEYGDLVPLRCDLDIDSPWFFESMQDFNYRFVGTVVEVEL